MGYAFLYGHGGRGGGAGLNYSVAAYASEASLPASASENQIAVITGAAITGHTFRNTQPETPKEGLVWITTGASGNIVFSATKDDPIMVYPISARQYLSGVWEEKTAKIYQNGSWQAWWNGQLYTPGNEWESITGGWTGIGKRSNSDSSVSVKAPTITRGSESITADADGVGGVFYCANKIDLTKYVAITIEGTFTRGGSTPQNVMLGCWENFDGTYYRPSAVTYQGMSTSSGTSLQLDVSSLSGEYYVGLGLTDSKAVVTRCYLS